MLIHVIYTSRQGRTVVLQAYGLSMACRMRDALNDATPGCAFLARPAAEFRVTAQDIENAPASYIPINRDF